MTSSSATGCPLDRAVRGCQHPVSMDRIGGSAAVLKCWTDRYKQRYRSVVTDFESSDFFRGRDLIADPYGYFDWLRTQCPVHREPHHGVMMVTGYDEAAAISANTSTFSSCNSP